MSVHCVASSVWIEGEFARDLEALDRARTAKRTVIEPSLLLRGDRIARADRITQIASVVVADAMKSAARTCDIETMSVITASCLATAHTNERFELRRLEAKAPEPRSFPYTAPNATAGEISIALGARGPSLALVGDAEVGVIAVSQATRWLERNECSSVLIVAVECPPEHAERVGCVAQAPFECAVAMLLASGDGPVEPIVSFTSTSASSTGSSETRFLSVDPLARWLLGSSTVTVQTETNSRWTLACRGRSPRSPT